MWSQRAVANLFHTYRYYHLRKLRDSCFIFPGASFSVGLKAPTSPSLSLLMLPCSSNNIRGNVEIQWAWFVTSVELNILFLQPVALAKMIYFV